MITTEAASLALSIAQGLVKLGGRIDRLMAEKEASTGQYILPMPPVRYGPGGVKMVEDLNALLVDTEGKTPDPLAPYRGEITALIAQDTPDPKKVFDWYKRFFPSEAFCSLINPDDEYLKELKRRFPTLDLDDESTLYAAFSISAGRDEREIGYPVRVALVVVDVLAEFGAENAAVFVHDEKIRPIVRSVLERFSVPDPESYSMWSPLLRHALASTLNGVLDSREAWQGENEWMNAALNALLSARLEAGDDYLLGLLQGKGYRLLISDGLSEAARVLSDDTASPFETIMSDILKEAAPRVKEDAQDFGPFFQDHWGDLFRAVLRSLEKYGPKILEDESPILRDTLKAMVKVLANTSDTNFLSHETLFNLSDAALSAVATRPNLITGDIEEPWLKLLITSVTQTVGDQDVRRSLSKDGLEYIINGTLEAFAIHPELIIEKPGLVQEMVGSVLKKVIGMDSGNAEAIATAAVEGALDAVAENPALLDTHYAELVADFAGKMAKTVADKTLTGTQATDIITASTEAILLNPILFVEFENKFTEAVVDAVLKAAEKEDMKLLYGTVLVSVVDQLLGTVARYGRTLIEDGSPHQLADRLTHVISAGLIRAKADLGRNLDIPSLPIVLSGLVAAVARGELDAVDPEDPIFKQLVADLAAHAAA